MADFFTVLPKFVKEMNKAELEEYFRPGIKERKQNKKGEWIETPFYTKAYLMRSIIMNELKFNKIDYERTLRGIWYSSVKPTLEKLGILEDADMDEDELMRWDKRLSKMVCDLLRRGYLTFGDLSISDTSRQKSNPFESYYTVDNEIYGYKGNLAPYPNILIATEKDTVYSIVKDLATLFGCSCLSCKGQNSLGAMEYIVKGMLSRYRNYPDFDTIYILTLTDYDPAGYYIADALFDQMNDILYALGKDGQFKVEIKRIGITPDQLSDELVLANMYTPRPANMDKWMELTNGINGQRKGLELDALTPPMIREIFVDELSEFIDSNVYKSFTRNSYIRKVVLDAIKDNIEKIMSSTILEFEDEVELIDFDILQLGKDGRRLIPIDDTCSDEKDEEIKQFVKSYFKPENEI